MRAVVLLAAVLALAGCAAKPIAPGAGAPDLLVRPIPLDLNWAGSGCTELGAVVPVPAANVRSSVPAKYKLLLDAKDLAQVLVGSYTCQSLSISDGGIGAISASDVGVLVEDPEGKGQMSVYQLWQVTDRPDFSESIHALGLPGGPATVEFKRPAGPSGVKANPVRTASARIAWDVEPYSIGGQLTSADPGTAPFGTVVWWHEGERGTLRMEYTFTPSGMVGGAGSVEAKAGGALATALGGTVGAGPAVYWTFTFSSAAKLV